MKTEYEEDLKKRFVGWMIKLGIKRDPKDKYADKDIVTDIHMQNSFARGKANTGIRDFPDHMFPYNRKIYMVELGIKGRNKERKARQRKTMEYWQFIGGVFTATLQTPEEIDNFFKLISKT